MRIQARFWRNREKIYLYIGKNIFYLYNMNIKYNIFYVHIYYNVTYINIYCSNHFRATLIKLIALTLLNFNVIYKKH